MWTIIVVNEIFFSLHQSIPESVRLFGFIFFGKAIEDLSI